MKREARRGEPRASCARVLSMRVVLTHGFTLDPPLMPLERAGRVLPKQPVALHAVTTYPLTTSRRLSIHAQAAPAGRCGTGPRAGQEALGPKH